MQKAVSLNDLTQGGLVLGQSKDGHSIYYTPEDTHSLILGATRCGKTRCLVEPSIAMTALAGESMVMVDMKGELYTAGRYFLESLGYEVIAIDFLNPQYSNRYNFMQPVIDALNQRQVAKAAMRARDMATMLVPENHANESIWVDGARAVLTMSSLICAYDNVQNPQYQNLANVQQFITHMCRPIGAFGLLPLNLYLDMLPDDHPAKLSMGISQIAPSKMRGSFYTSVLSTLDVFTDPLIHAMTASTDFDPELTGVRKRAIFLILPDYKKTYHSLAALFIYQQYQLLAEYSTRHGGRLPRRVHFFCDEFGNFVKIPDFDTLMTVSGGRGIRWHLFLQNLEQLDEKYGDKVGKTIRSNAETWVYLRSNSPETRKEISNILGNYTVKSPSLSGSSNGQRSASYNLTGRALMLPDEIHKHIQRPYQLVLTPNDPAMMYAPDISQTIWNAAYGMGDPKYNQKMSMLRDRDRIEHHEEAEYWGVWNRYVAELKAADTAAQQKK
ncbi:VirD4-like conjugal transfer protein, CD1115 family [Oscillibacter ruminantium]